MFSARHVPNEAGVLLVPHALCCLLASTAYPSQSFDITGCCLHRVKQDDVLETLMYWTQSVMYCRSPLYDANTKHACLTLAHILHM